MTLKQLGEILWKLYGKEEHHEQTEPTPVDLERARAIELEWYGNPRPSRYRPRPED